MLQITDRSQLARCYCPLHENRSRKNKRHLLMIILVAMSSACTFSGCSGDKAGSVDLGTYVYQLCEAIGPFEREAQGLGRVIGREGLEPRSSSARQAVIRYLTAASIDVRYVAARLKKVGFPGIDRGEMLAREMIATFEKIDSSYEQWRLELTAVDKSRSMILHANHNGLQISLEALLLVGRQVENLPDTKERRSAMERSPVCREVFGSLRLSERMIVGTPKPKNN